MTDLIVGLVVVLMVAAASLYIYRAKKRGAKCIGCPEGSCGGNCSCCSSCHHD